MHCFQVLWNDQCLIIILKEFSSPGLHPIFVCVYHGSPWMSCVVLPLIASTVHDQKKVQYWRLTWSVISSGPQLHWGRFQTEYYTSGQSFIGLLEEVMKRMWPHQLTHKQDLIFEDFSLLPCVWYTCCPHSSHSGSCFQGCRLERSKSSGDHLTGSF